MIVIKATFQLLCLKTVCHFYEIVCKKSARVRVQQKIFQLAGTRMPIWIQLTSKKKEMTTRLKYQNLKRGFEPGSLAFN